MSATFEMADMTSESTDNRHHDLRPKEIERSQMFVKKTKEAIASFVDPLNVDTDQLVVL